MNEIWNPEYETMSRDELRELQFKRLGKDTAKKISRYLNLALTKELVGTRETRIFRVIPIKQKVAADLYVYPYEKVASIIESADQVCLTQCFCRTHKETAGESCGRRTTLPKPTSASCGG